MGGFPRARCQFSEGICIGYVIPLRDGGSEKRYSECARWLGAAEVSCPIAALVVVIRKPGTFWDFLPDAAIGYGMGVVQSLIPDDAGGSVVKGRPYRAAA